MLYYILLSQNLNLNPIMDAFIQKVSRGFVLLSCAPADDAFEEADEGSGRFYEYQDLRIK